MSVRCHSNSVIEIGVDVKIDVLPQSIDVMFGHRIEEVT
jgi:hypothetical protein